MKKKVLVIYYLPPQRNCNSNFEALINIFDKDAAYIVKKLNYADYNNDSIQNEINSTDVIFLHYSLLYQRVRKGILEFFDDLEAIKSSKALKVAMPQDEGNCPGVLDDLLTYWKIDLLLSVHYSKDGFLYPNARNEMEIINVLPAFIKQAWLKNLPPIPDLKTRPITLGYRGRPRLWKAGKANFLKSDFPLKLSKFLEGADHITDVSVNSIDRIYGDDWGKFIQNSRTIFGSPGGYTAIDFYGELELKTKKITSEEKPTNFNDFNVLMGPEWDNYQLLTITQRHFEAAYLGTPQILIESHYKELVEPNKHYVPILDNQESFESLLSKIEDFDYLRSTVENFRNDVFRENLSYEFLVDMITQAIIDHSGTKKLSTLTSENFEINQKYAEARLYYLSNNDENTVHLRDFVSSKIKKHIRQLIFKVRKILFSLRRAVRISYYTFKKIIINMTKFILKIRFKQ